MAEEEGDKAKEKIVSREELIGLVQLVIIFTAMLAGREIGNLYGSYRELSNLSVNLSFSEEEMSTYLRDTMQGRNATLTVGMASPSPASTAPRDRSRRSPTTFRKWLISVTLSPIVVNQPEVSDVDLVMYIEGHQVLSKNYTFPRAKVGYITY